MFRSTVPSIPIADASTGASIVSRDRRMRITGCPPVSISKPSYSTSRTPPNDCARNCTIRNIRSTSWHSARTRTLINPLSASKNSTRRILEVLAAYNHPFGIVTKSDLVLRDADIIAPMAEKGMAVVTLSVTTLDRDLARKLEPRAPTPPKRLAAIGTLAALGIPTGVLTAPMIPALNDMELERILEAAAKAGASGAGYVLLRLPLEIADLFKEWLETHYPDKADHVLSLVKQTRDGAMYDSRWGQRAVGSGPYADLLNQRFKLALKKIWIGQTIARSGPRTVRATAPKRRSVGIVLVQAAASCDRLYAGP